MSKIIKLTLLVFLLSSTLNAEKLKVLHTFELKKDQFAIIEYNNNNHKSKLFFRWTLFTSNQLILLATNDNFPTQHFLEKKFHLNGVKFNIFKEQFSNFKDDRVYFLVIFDDFDQKKSIAKFDIYLKDDNNNLKVKFIDPEKEKRSASKKQ
jgi:hypothetical protein